MRGSGPKSQLCICWVRPDRFTGQMMEESIKTSFGLAVAASIGLGGLGVAAAPTSAMPLRGLDPALASSAETTGGVEAIRWICGPYGGCRWVPGRRRYGWGPRWGDPVMAIGVRGPGALTAGDLIVTGITGSRTLSREARASFPGYIIAAGKVSRSAQPQSRPRCVPRTGVIFCGLVFCVHMAPRWRGHHATK
jgi:hypothetical protein